MPHILQALIPLTSLILVITGGIVWWNSLNYMKPGVDLSMFRGKHFSKRRELFVDGGYRRYRMGQFIAAVGWAVGITSNWIQSGF